MEERDYIKDLFREKLSQHEAPVNPELWSSISAQIGGSAVTAASTGLSVISKVLIGAAVVAAATITVVILVKNSEKTELQNAVSAKQSIEQSTEHNETEKESVSTDDKSNVEVREVTVPQPDGNIVENNTDEIKEVLILPVEKEENNRDLVNENKDVSSTKETDRNEHTESSNTGSQNVASSKGTSTSEEEKVKEADITLVLPNTFTPNGDGYNDELFIEGLKDQDLSDFTLIVLNTSNKIVYQTTDPGFRWNGVSLHGDIVPAGNYIYYLTAKDASGKPITKYSRLTITR